MKTCEVCRQSMPLAWLSAHEGHEDNAVTYICLHCSPPDTFDLEER